MCIVELSRRQFFPPDSIDFTTTLRLLKPVLKNCPCSNAPSTLLFMTSTLCNCHAQSLTYPDLSRPLSAAKSFPILVRLLLQVSCLCFHLVVVPSHSRLLLFLQLCSGVRRHWLRSTSIASALRTWSIQAGSPCSAHQFFIHGLCPVETEPSITVPTFS